MAKQAHLFVVEHLVGFPKVGNDGLAFRFALYSQELHAVAS